MAASLWVVTIYELFQCAIERATLAHRSRLMKMKIIAAGVLAASTMALLQACGGSSAVADVPSMLAVNKADVTYFSARGQQRLSEEQARQAIASGKAKNVILFVGDGFGISTLTAARIFDGQEQNKDGESNALYMESLPYLALSRIEGFASI